MVSSCHAAAISCAGATPHREAQKEKFSECFAKGLFAPYQEIHYFEPQLPCETGTTAGASAERAALLCRALTKRDIALVWATRGGYGTTAIWTYLKNILPPVLPKKYFIGYSDNSFIGNVLSFYYNDFNYIHYRHAFDSNMLNSKTAPDVFSFQSLLKNPTLWSLDIPLFPLTPLPNDTITSGYLLPFNLSLGESLCSLEEFPDLPEDFIFFMEDCNEDTYCLLRKIDTLFNNGLLKKAKAFVLGEFTHAKKIISAYPLGQWIHQKTGKPVFSTNRFGHGQWNVPLVWGSPVKIQYSLENGWQAHLSGSREWKSAQKLSLDHLFPPQKIHFLGIGGTGMAAVAGITHQAGFTISGSDGKLYPPMDAVINALPIDFHEGYSSEFIKKISPQYAVVANAISRKSETNPGNEELEYILEKGVPFFSFPSFLNRSFLKKTTNIVVCGTHGKTTTTSLTSHILVDMGAAPSYIIGGTPIGFSSGYHFGKGSTFVLEGDEYDSAFFDKGPKFLNYNPKIAIIGNIEYDHADIYPSIEAIENEFLLLLELVFANGGVVVANTDCPRVRRLLQHTPSLQVLAYGTHDHPHLVWKIGQPAMGANGYSMVIHNPRNPQDTATLESQLFGLHNVYNTCAALTAVLAWEALQDPSYPNRLTEWVQAHQSRILEKLKKPLQSFQGVKRRFEKLGRSGDVDVFDDFAHHPTAVQTTIQTFLNYMAQGRPPGAQLRVCFDPKNATLRRNTLQNELAQSFQGAHRVYLGKSHLDERVPPDQRFSSQWVAKNSLAPTIAFDDNHILLQTLEKDVKPGDVVVFMSSGSFDGLPFEFLRLLSLKG